MNDAVERGSQVMEKAWESWKKMIGSQAWWPTDTQASPWFNAEPLIASWRSANDFQNRSWKIVRENSEAAMLKIMKESQLYAQAQEAQVKEFWNRINQSAQAREQRMDDMFQRWEDMVKPKSSEQ